jgi:hypothetical protein
MPEQRVLGTDRAGRNEAKATFQFEQDKSKQQQRKFRMNIRRRCNIRSGCTIVDCFEGGCIDG